MLNKISANLRKTQKNRINLFLIKRNKQKNPSINKKRSKYLDDLFSKRIESQMLLEKSKIDYYIEKYRNYKNFHRDYAIFFSDNINNNINNNILILNKNKSLNIIKNRSLPNISDRKMYSNKKIISKNRSLEKKIFPHLYKPEKYFFPRPNFSNNYVNNKIYNKIYYRNDRNKLDNIYDNNTNGNYKIKNEINSYIKK